MLAGSALIRRFLLNSISRWRPFARRVFLMHRVDELPYGLIAIAVDVDVATVERCVADALWSVRMVRREFE